MAAAAAASAAAASVMEVDLADKKCLLSGENKIIFINLGDLTIRYFSIVTKNLNNCENIKPDLKKDHFRFVI